MTGRSDLTIFAELDLDASRYTAAQQKLLREATQTTLNIEQNFRNLGIKSAAEFDLMRRKVQNSFDMIANSAKATANDRVRAEKAMHDQIQRINEQQYGKQISTIDKLKSNWIAASVAIGAAMVAASKAWDLIKQGADYAEQQGILNNLARKYSQTADSIVASMQRASDGLIARADLMQVALAGIAKGLNPEQLTNLADAAKILGDAVGKDATTALQDLTTALETGRTKGLKNYLGTAIDLEKVFGDLYSKLTEAEKAQALYNITMIEATKLQSQQTGAVSETADEIERLEADFKNVKLSMATFFMEFAVRAYNSLNIMAKSRAAWGAVTGILDRPMGPEITVPQPGQGVADYQAQLASLRAQLRNRKTVSSSGGASGGAGSRAAASSSYLESTRALLAPYQADEDWAQYFEGYVKAQEELKKKAEERYGTEQQWSYDTTQKLLANARKVQSVSEDVWDKQGYYFLLTGEKTKEANAQILQQMIDDYEKTFVGGWKAGLVKIEQYQTTWGDVMQQMALETHRAMADGFSDVFYDAFTGKMKSLEDYWKKMSKSILRSFTDMIGKMASEKIMLYFKSEWTTGGADVLNIVSKVLGVAGNVFNDFGGGDYLGSSSSTYLSLARGGFVGGGDSVLNDTVPAMLSPGEFVVPRSVVSAVASKGQQGDTMLAHINPTEAWLLKALGGAGTINPQTGLPQFFNRHDVFNIATLGGYGMLTGKWGHLGAMWSFLNPGFVSAYKASKSHDVWDLIDAVFDPVTGPGITTLLGAVGGEVNKLLPWVGDLIESIAPTVGGMVGAFYGGPGGAAGGAAAGSGFASKWNKETNEQALQKAAITAAITYVAQGAGKYVGGATGSKVAGSAASMATGYAAKYIINAALGDKLAKDEIALGQLAISYAGSNDGGMLSYLSGAMKGMSDLVHPVSARNGLYYVPADNYPISAHKGEAVLNRREADVWRGGGVTVIIQGNVVDHDKFAREMVPAITKAVRAGVH